MNIISRPASQDIADRGADFALLKDAVREAGKIARGFFGRDIAVDRKADNSEVTEADRTVDSFLKETLTSARPGYGWLSEETEDSGARLAASRVWVVDPIDGTRAFIQRKSEWVVSAALVEDGYPVLAAVYNPLTEEFFSAHQGMGAHLNDSAIEVNRKRDLEGSLVLGSKGLLKHPDWKSPWPEVRLEWVYSIAYRLALVAQGAADATIALSPKSEWDIAAAVLLVQEAGGRVSDPVGDRLKFNNPVPKCGGIIAAGPHLHELIARRMGSDAR